jgi:phospholipid/cholesterol/gamma-HCH transport system substrate-binding protein
MNTEDRGTQLKVGLFLLAGLVMVGLMVVYFGRLGEGFAKYYTVRVEFTNASGLLRGSEVLLAGAKIGRVLNAPTILPDMKGIYVDVRILDEVKIPADSTFVIGSSGLLGDKFIEIKLDGDGKKVGFIKAGDIIKGADDSGGIASMADGAGELMAELKTTIKNINNVVLKLDQTVLAKEELASITKTIKNLETATTQIAEASGKAGKLVDNADKTIESGKKAAEELNKTITSINALVEQIRSGKGLLGALVNNQQLALNLEALIINLRRHGVLWYKDTVRQTAGDSQ